MTVKGWSWEHRSNRILQSVTSMRVPPSPRLANVTSCTCAYTVWAIASPRGNSETWSWRSVRLVSHTTRVHTLARPLTSVGLGWRSWASVPQFPNLWNGDDEITFWRRQSPEMEGASVPESLLGGELGTPDKCYMGAWSESLLGLSRPVFMGLLQHYFKQYTTSQGYSEDEMSSTMLNAYRRA